MSRRLALVLAACAVSPVFADELSMADLKALDKQHQFRELLERADQVKPAARTADWAPLVTHAAVEVLRQLENVTDVALINNFALVVLRSDFPFLVADKAYLAERARVVDHVVAACDGQDQVCGWIAMSLARDIPLSGDTARALALRLHDVPLDAMEYWAIAADANHQACREPGLQRAVLETMRRLPVGHAAGAQRAATTCFAELEDALLSELVANKGPFSANACPVLKTHGPMTVVKKKHCP